jgi:hypothetical protein
MSVQQSVVDVTVTPQPADAAKPRRFTRRAAAWLAWSLWAFFVILEVFSLLLTYANHPASFVTDLSGALILLAYMTVGALIASRRPENAVGWIFCAIALSLAIGFFAEYYAVYTLVTNPGSLPFGPFMAWSSIWTRDIGFVLVFTFLILLFPTGRLPSERWRPIARLTFVVLVLISVWESLQPGPLPFAPSVSNPFGVETPDYLHAILGLGLFIFLLAITAACVASLIARFRRASGDERQQLKWFVFASVPLVIMAVMNPFQQDLGPAFVEIYDVLFRLSVAALPIAAGIAILRHHLYDIDLIINRTLVYVPLTAILAGAYAALMAFLQRFFVALTGEESDAAIVLTTLGLTASFTPLKNGLQIVVDKGFKEAPDSTKKLKALGERVQSDISVIDRNKATRRLLDEAAAAFHAQSGAIYLQQNGHRQLLHTYGDWRDADSRISVPLESEGEHLGLLELGVRRNGLGYTDKERQLLQEVADQVAVAIIRQGEVHD